MKFEIELSKETLERVRDALIDTSDSNLRTSVSVIKDLFLIDGFPVVDLRKKVKVKSIKEN